MYCRKVQKWILSNEAIDYSYSASQIILPRQDWKKLASKPCVSTKRTTSLPKKKIKSTKHQRREKMQLLNDPSLSQNGFVIFFSKQTLWWINTRRGVQYSAEGVSVETAVKHLRMCGCCRGQATDRVILWTTTWARKLKLIFKLLWSKL